MKKIYSLVIILCLSNVFLAFGQSKKHSSKKKVASESNLLSEADYFFGEENYIRALPVYLKLIDIDSVELYYKQQAGICYLHKGDEKDKSITLLESVYQQDPSAKDILYYLGRSYHLNYQFDKAIGYFNQYLNSKPKPSADMQKMAQRYIDYCNNAKKLVGTKVHADIANLGPVINTSASEYAPVVSADESVLMFTYRGARSTGGLEDTKFKPDTTTGEYYEDVFVSQKVGNTWLSPSGAGDHINTKGHDASIGISADGQTLFTYRSTPSDNGDIYVSHLNGTEWTTPRRLGPNINTKYWEGSCSLSADGQTLYFASERPGGFGGRDIYMSKLQSDGDWGKATNLGPNINTPYNDDAPYIHPDGVTLFFSSEGHNSMGGSDIFYATYKDSAWSTAINIGYPVNSTEDDRYYVLSADGSRGYFSSNRQGGYGQQDIYVVSPGFQGEKPILALVVGVVTADDKPADATIKVTNAETGENKGTFQSNSSTGKYLIALTPGNKYKVAIEVEGFQPHIEYVDVKSLDTYVQVAENVHLYSDAYKAKHGVATVADSSEPLQSNIDQQLARYHAEDNLDVYESDMYQKIVNEHADAKEDSISYNVELGTYARAADFDSTKVASLGHITKRVDAQGHTTYSMGPFKTLLDAEVFKYQVFKQDSSFKKHTVVTVNDKGTRELIQQYYAAEYTRKGYVPETDTKVIPAQTQAIVGLNDQATLNPSQLNNDYGKSHINGLSFKIELGAFKDTSDFKLGYLKKYGKIHQKTYPDGTIHYTMGPFATLEEADNFKKMLIEKEPQTQKALVMVFYFGKEQTVNDFFSDPCASGDGQKADFSEFKGKDLNDTAVYHKLIFMAGQICSDSLTFVVQIGAYRHPQNFKHKNLNTLEPPPAVVKNYPDGITRFTMRTFKTLRQAELFRQQIIKLGTKDAWITGIYKGQRVLLQDLIANNFYNASIN